jgi:uncharacterized protein YndB with AHSA1/START domain
LVTYSRGHGRWSLFAGPLSETLSEPVTQLEEIVTTMTDAPTTQVYQVFIKATPEQIWEAITTPEFTARYFHGARIEMADGRYISHGPNGDVWGDDKVLEWDPPRRLVHGWRSMYDAEMAAEEASRVSWEIEPGDDGTCMLTVVHDRLEGAPKTAASISGPGWMGVLSGLKTLLETGEPLFGLR